MSAFKAVNGVATSPQAESAPVETPAEAPSVEVPPTEAPAAETNSTPAPPAERPASSSTPPMNRTSAEPPPGARESWPTQGPDRTGEEEGSHKRKRSESAEGAHYEHSGPDKTPENAAQPAPSTEDRDHYPTPVSREYRPYDDREREREREHDLWGHGRRDEHAGYDYSGAHTNGHHDHDDPGSDPAHHQRAESEYSNTSPDVDERDGGKYSHIYAEIRGDHLLAHDPKKRKRNFSNRTKTGCLTCRKRKKKCDEQKPECNNCIRGGFVCAGYPPQRGAWPTKIGIDHKPGAIPLESKDPSYIPPGAYGLPAMYGPPKRDNRGQPLRIDPPQGRPVMTDDDRYTASTIPSASVTSPDHNKMSTMPYTPANAFPTPVSANTQPPFDRMGKDYQRVPPMHEFSRPEHRGEHGNQLPQISMLHSARTSSPNTHSTSVTSNPPAAGQHNANSSQYSSQRRTQKEEMLNGRHFYAFDKELCLERERCATACWRFNNLTAPPANGVSPDERARLFLDILQPREPIRLSASEASPVTNVGRVGRHVAVETPFMSDYGYNISIGHHVVIGRNCTINDVCEVRIGDNCVIGPNVSIYTTNLPIDPKKRQGGQGPQYGRPVVIEQDCWIGGGATILPGRTIGKGSTVGAGSVVTKDVPPFTVVAGNPARVLRGIAS